MTKKEYLVFCIGFSIVLVGVVFAIIKLTTKDREDTKITNEMCLPYAKLAVTDTLVICAGPNDSVTKKVLK